MEIIIFTLFLFIIISSIIMKVKNKKDIEIINKKPIIDDEIKKVKEINDELQSLTKTLGKNTRILNTYNKKYLSKGNTLGDNNDYKYFK